MKTKMVSNQMVELKAENNFQETASFPLELSVMRRAIKSDWTLNLVICCICAATASLQFGYNNLLAQLVVHAFQALYWQPHVHLRSLQLKQSWSCSRRGMG
jgi:hypothetical protein